jgi:GH15 family glucan-1,4-alpha-glucosidase
MSEKEENRQRSAGGQALDLALIGNCRTAALIDPLGRIVWWCFPRFDSNPIFCRLLTGEDEKGFCDVILSDLVDARSAYVRNTAILETELEDKHGGRVKITDFAPRFHRYERTFHPPQLVRRIQPIAGLPRITIRVRPTEAYGRTISDISIGSNHIRYQGTGSAIEYGCAPFLCRAREDLSLDASYDAGVRPG